MNLKKRLKKYTRSKKGFTLVELVAVVAIIAIISTASLSVFVAVQQSVRDTGKLTAEQYTTTQIEKFIRNEFQVASNVDVLKLVTATKVPDYPMSNPAYATYTVSENDEFLYFQAPSASDPTASTKGRLYFMKADSTKTFKAALMIDDVEEVTIDICPVRYEENDLTKVAKNVPLKMVYNIKTTNYTYSGGIVLGNTKTTRDRNMQYFDPDYFAANLNWKKGSADNAFCIAFHSETTKSSSSSSSP